MSLVFIACWAINMLAPCLSARTKMKTTRTCRALRASKRKLHARIERNRTLSRRAKKIHGYRCQACAKQLDEVYGVVAKNVIEAHHIVPLAALNGKQVSLDPKMDFAVLCPNCHRVIHRTTQPDKIAALRRL